MINGVRISEEGFRGRSRLGGGTERPYGPVRGVSGTKGEVCPLADNPRLYTQDGSGSPEVDLVVRPPSPVGGDGLQPHLVGQPLGNRRLGLGEVLG